LLPIFLPISGEVAREAFDPEQVDPSTRISPAIEIFQGVDVSKHAFSIDKKRGVVQTDKFAV
jgi:hypothetical protein